MTDKNMPIFPDEPDAFVCGQCGGAHSYSRFNCTCGYMDCGHGWRTGGEMRDGCLPCIGELKELRDAVKTFMGSTFSKTSKEWEAVVQAYEGLRNKA